MFNEQKLQLWSKIFAVITVITAIINKFVIILQNKLAILVFLEFTVFCFLLFFLYIHNNKNKAIFIVIMYIASLIYIIILKKAEPHTEKHPRNNKDLNPPVPPSREEWAQISQI